MDCVVHLRRLKYNSKWLKEKTTTVTETNTNRTMKALRGFGILPSTSITLRMPVAWLGTVLLAEP